MYCQECDTLLANYKDAVKLFKDAVHNAKGTPGDDGLLTAKMAERLSQNCKSASEALMEHWRKEHSLVANSGSS
jgi:hypothetical protein